MATIVTRYLNTASTTGGDGTTNATTGANRAYANFGDWQTAEVKNLVTANEIHKLICSGGNVSENIDITGWTTDIDRFVWVTVEAASRHGGTPGSGFRITASANWSSAFFVSQDYTIVEWLEGISTQANSSAGIQLAGLDCLAVGCIGSATGNLGGIRLAGSATGDTNIAVSCLSLNSDGADGFHSSNWNHSKAYNCTSVNSGDAGFEKVSTGQELVTINCAAYGNTGADFVSGGAWGAGTSNNASEDLTAPGTSPTTGLVSGDFTNTATDDYSIAGTGSKLYAGGVSIETELVALDRTQYTVPREDIAGNDFEATMDIGAYVFVAAGTTLTIQSANHGVISDAITLTQSHALGINDGPHTHGANNPTLSQGQILTIGASNHALSSDSLSLAQAHEITTNVANNAVTSADVILAQLQSLVIQNSTHGISSDQAGLFDPTSFPPNPDRTHKADRTDRTSSPENGNRTIQPTYNRTLRI